MARTGRPQVRPDLTHAEIEQIAAAFAREGSALAAAKSLGRERTPMIRDVERAGWEFVTVCYLQKKGEPAKRLP